MGWGWLLGNKALADVRAGALPPPDSARAPPPPPPGSQKQRGGLVREAHSDPSEDQGGPRGPPPGPHLGFRTVRQTEAGRRRLECLAVVVWVFRGLPRESQVCRSSLPLRARL